MFFPKSKIRLYSFLERGKAGFLLFVVRRVLTLYIRLFWGNHFAIAPTDYDANSS